MFTIVSNAHIQADAATVYRLLIELKHYHSWNPWIIEASGEPQVGGPLISVAAKLGKQVLRVQHKIVEMQPNQRFVWCDTGWFTIFAFGQRTRTLSPSANGVNYRVELSISGPLAFLVRFWHGAALQAGLASETQALKHCAEAQFANPSNVQ